jgi:chromatin remodeling complex protein RSC6
MEDISISLNKILFNIENLKLNLNVLKKDVKELEKKTKKQMNKLNKNNKKIKSQKSQKQPSGFAKPTNVSKDLCEFMNLEEGSKIARTEVTKYIIDYIKENKLQDEKNKKYIKPDNKLRSLFGIKNEQIGFFDIQKYMNKHYNKNYS